MKSSRLIVACLVGLVIGVPAVPAAPAAPAKARPVVFVSNPEPALEPYKLDRLLEELGKKRFVVYPWMAQMELGPRFPMAAHDPNMTSAGYAKRLEQAYAMWLQQPPLGELLPVLESTVAMIQRNPLLLIRDPSQRVLVHKILVARALAYQRAGNLKRSEDSMAELICMSPSYVVSRSVDGPAAEQLHQQTRANLAKRGRGTLTVKVNHPEVQVYIDERITRPNVPMMDMASCTHRVVLLDPLDRARRYEVDVARNQNTTLEVDWDVDTAVQDMRDWIELRFQTETEYAQRAEIARQLVDSSKAGAEVFVLIDVVTKNGQRRVVGSLRSVRRGQVLREASFAIPVDDEIMTLITASRTAWELPHFLAGGLATSGIQVHTVVDLSIQRDPATAGERVAAPRTDSPWPPRYVLAAGGAVLLGSGIYMLYRAQERNNCNALDSCSRHIPLGVGSVIAILLGTGLTEYALVSWLVDLVDPPSVALQLAPGHHGGLLVATWRTP